MLAAGCRAHIGRMERPSARHPLRARGTPGGPGSRGCARRRRGRRMRRGRVSATEAVAATRAWRSSTTSAVGRRVGDHAGVAQRGRGDRAPVHERDDGGAVQRGRGVRGPRACRGWRRRDPSRSERRWCSNSSCEHRDPEGRVRTSGGWSAFRATPRRCRSILRPCGSGRTIATASRCLRGHRFPLPKYRLLREGLVEREGLVGEANVRLRRPRRVEPCSAGPRRPPTSTACATAGSARREERALGPALVAAARRARPALDGRARSRRARRARADWHEPRRRHPPRRRRRARGYCLFNDVVVAIAALRRARAPSGASLGRRLRRPPGRRDGRAARRATRAASPCRCTAARTTRSSACRPTSTSTCHRHRRRRLPRGARRTRSTVAVPVAHPDLAFFLAGADPWEGDRLGRLALTKAGLRARDALVLDTAGGSAPRWASCSPAATPPTSRTPSRSTWQPRALSPRGEREDRGPCPSHRSLTSSEGAREPEPVVIGRLPSDGAPNTVATWYLWEDGRVLVNMDEAQAPRVPEAGAARLAHRPRRRNRGPAHHAGRAHHARGRPGPQGHRPDLQALHGPGVLPARPRPRERLDRGRELARLERRQALESVARR